MTSALLLLLAAAQSSAQIPATSPKTSSETPSKTAAPAASPFTCDVSNLETLDSGVGVVAINDPKTEAALIATFKAAAARYPGDSFSSEVRGVTLVRGLVHKGRAILGIAYPSQRWMIISVEWSGKPQPAVELARTFHHETAHILAQSYSRRFRRAAWIGTNAPGFLYREDPRYNAATDKTSGLTGDPALLFKQGLVNDYAASSFDEDVASVAERLLTVDKASEAELLRLVRKSPRLAMKCEILAEFYRTVFGEISLPEM